jgi:hypothetical protein
MRRRDIERRQAWMRTYSDTLTAELPAAAAGRIDWDTAVFLYNSGKDAEDAARQQAESLRERWIAAFNPSN